MACMCFVETSARVKTKEMEVCDFAHGLSLITTSSGESLIFTWI